ncbi:MAG: THUMP-like domain-containing protein, partial [Pirellulaceae bacterium]
MEGLISPKNPDPLVWLTSDAALPYLDVASRELKADSLVRLTAKLRKTLSAEQVHLVLEQVDLRRRAAEKFSAAEQMFFTPKSLMQASDETIAACKAARFSKGGSFADLCCGIGGDLLALAGKGTCVGVDLDAGLVHLAQRNCEVTGRAGGRAIVAGAATFPVHEYSAWHIDPDRRPSGKRTTQVEHYQPPLEVLEALLMKNPQAAIKLAPAAQVPANWEQSAEREWLESRGECRQQVAWFGSLARHPGEKAATIVDAIDGPRTVQGRGEGSVPVADKISRYVYEPAAVVLAAKLTHVLCGEHHLKAVTSQAMYLTGDAMIQDAALAGFEVLEVLPHDERQLKAWLRQRGIGRLEVKKRGCDVETEKLRKKLGGQGDESATLLICPVGGKVQAIVARRVG